MFEAWTGTLVARIPAAGKLLAGRFFDNGDGVRIVTGSVNGLAQTWFADPADLLEAARRLATRRRLTQAEQDRYDDLLDRATRDR